jgi:Mrp family chromosome partitioning ATPase
MGRMFRIITEGNLDFPPAGHTVVAEGEPFVQTGAPFIEVGGPTGVVHSLPKPVQRITVTEPPRPPVVTRTVADDRYLSVALHQIATPKPVEVAPSPVSPDVVAYHHPKHAVSAEYRGLRDEMKRQVGTDGPKAVLFTAAASDNGTTTVLLNLAVSLAAEAGARVLVLDAELDRPAAARKMGLSDLPGLSEVLSQTTPLAWVLQPTVVPRLQVLGAGKPTDSTPAALATDLPRVVTQLRQWFDWILVDGGVWGARPHRDGASPAFDGVYLVTRQAELDRPVFHALRAEVARHGGLLRGYITTR